MGKSRFRAIFAAYNEVLERNGLDPNHDQTLFRFLLKLGDQKRQGQSLYQSFESLLQELGIQIEINEDEGSVADITREIEEATADHGVVDRLQAAFGTSGPLSRRNSYDSLRYERNGVESGPQGFPPPRASIREASRPTERDVEMGRRSASAGNAAVTIRKDWVDGGPNIADGEVNQRPESRFTHKQKAKQHLQRHFSRDADTTVTLDGLPHQRFEEAHNKLSHTGREPSQQLYAVAQHELLYQPSETQCLRDADTFQHFHMRTLILAILHNWRRLAHQEAAKHRPREDVAVYHDQVVLLRQALDLWRNQVVLSRREKLTRKFYSELENRASRARNLYLLGKAFTHWVESTADEVLRTDIARQHILRLKYFNAWREITAVNELKVRRHGLTKYLGHWKEHRQLHEEKFIAAAAYSDRKLAKWVHWKWFWTFCEARAPIWRDARTKRAYFAKWIRAAERVKELEWETENNSYKKSISSVLRPWAQKADLRLSQQRSADDFCKNNIKVVIWRCWRRRRQHDLPERRISNMVDWRVAGTTFAVFVARFRLEKQAASICKVRLLRSAWVSWNDWLRCQVLARQIDDRVLLEALYRWVITERAALLRRLQAERLQHVALSKLYERCKGLRTVRERACQQVIQRRMRNLGQEILQSWQARLSDQRRNVSMAIAFQAPRLGEDVFVSLKMTFGHMRKLKTWAKRFDYFVVGRKLLKTWRNAVDESRKQKRQQAYGQVRRRTKMRLGSDMLNRWKGRTGNLQLLNEESTTIDQERLFRAATEIFAHWRARADSMLSLSYKAEHHRMLQTSLQKSRSWAHRLEDVRESNTQAAAFYNLHLATIVSTWLHEMRLKVIENRAQGAKAAALIRYYEKRRAGGLFRHWQIKTMEKLRRPPPQAPLSSRARRSALRTALPIVHLDTGDVGSEGLEQAFNGSTWIASDDADVTAAPGPSYLSTPSKRAARVKALVAGSTTPAGTPFLSRLRRDLSSSTPSPANDKVPKTPFSRPRFSRLRDQMEKEPQTLG